MDKPFTKDSHEAVNYRECTDIERRCATCTMYRTGRRVQPNHCVSVVNPIFSKYVCDIYEPKPTRLPAYSPGNIKPADWS